MSAHLVQGLLAASGRYVSNYTNGVLLTRFSSESDLNAGLIGLRLCGAQRAGISDLHVIGR